MNRISLRGIKDTIKRFIYEEDGVGVVEIILILVVLIALVALFKDSLVSLVEKTLKNITKNAGKI